ncbi:helix-turn-helix domain-containing protein [Robiginitalea marina]|uniref:Helix-turn-helix domain-containing protein n=1 Tax=Robiginitalea marina TaxID=2954105 RepID=A0ABT1AUN8_9FLAO|nr:helix-turn-helix transcriptional regulator [Robiginitalea marina]MCO5723596.1 helix-turn-helix domain-containing protein [Robiginitalea marina]
MVNIEEFKQRLEQIRSHYDLSAAALADAIGVQRSSISHLLSGRNKPSLDFVLKVVERFPEVTLNWLLEGVGHFPHEGDSQAGERSAAEQPPAAPGPGPDKSEIEKIVVFYKNGRFREYFPSGPATRK